MRGGGGVRVAHRVEVVASASPPGAMTSVPLPSVPLPDVLKANRAASWSAANTLE